MKFSILKGIVMGTVLWITGVALAGPPVDLWKPGEIWLAAEYGIVNRLLPAESTLGTTGDPMPSRSNRAILKAGYTIYPYLDLFGQLGFADLKINSHDPTFNDFQSDMTIAWGGGIKTGYAFPEWKVGTSLTNTVLSFSSSGEVSNQLRRVVNRYQWTEIQTELAVSYQLTSLTPFLGIEKTWLTGSHHIDDYFMGRRQPRPDDRETYSDPGQNLRPLAGLSLHAPGGYSVYLKASGLKSDELAVMIGVCQGSK